MRAFDACMRVAWLLVAIAAIVAAHQALTSNGQNQREARRRYTLTDTGRSVTVFDGETGVMRTLAEGFFIEVDPVNGTKRKLELRWAVEDEAEADTETPSEGR